MSSTEIELALQEFMSGIPDITCCMLLHPSRALYVAAAPSYLTDRSIVDALTRNSSILKDLLDEVVSTTRTWQEETLEIVVRIPDSNEDHLVDVRMLDDFYLLFYFPRPPGLFPLHVHVDALIARISSLLKRDSS